MKVLFIGPDSGTSRHRALAFERMGHAVRAIDPRKLLPRSSLIDRLEWKLHPAPLATWIRPRLLALVGEEHFDLVFVDSGSLVSPHLLRDLKVHCTKIVNYNVDDPFGPRDGRRFAVYRAAVPLYDLIVVVRQENVPEAYALGARRVLHTIREADEVAHAPRPITPEIQQHWGSEVAFVGTWMPERGPFLTRLLNLGVPLSIFGSRWEKSPEWPSLRGARRTQHLEGDQYCYAIQCAKICIGMLSIGNRDLHTHRSVEIPSLGSVLCAERTTEHLQLYSEGAEAVFWNDADECAKICAALLKDDERRKQIAELGHARCLANGHFTEPLLAKVIDASFS